MSNVGSMNKAKQSAGFIPEWRISDRLRRAREHSGLGQVEFAEKTGISRATISNAETGRSEPQKTTIKVWALATGVNYEWLLTGKTPPPNDGDGVECRAPSQIRTDDLFFKRRQKVIKLHRYRQPTAA